MPELITLGETMVCFSPSGNETLQYGNLFEKRIAGAESNVAIAMVRLGHSAGWISKLGNDSFGRYIRNTIRGEGVDISQVSMSTAYPTGLMFKQTIDSGDPQVTYYRHNSAASHLLPTDFSADYFNDCKVFHTTGINAALNSECFSAMKQAISTAREKNCLISFDPNIRLKLCSPDQIREPLLEILSQTDIALLGSDEAALIFQTNNTDEILSALFELGVTYVGLKLSDKGSIAATRNQRFFSPSFPVKKIDSIGAGDAFNTGFLAGILDAMPLEKCIEYGNAMGAIAVTSKGDYESLPLKEELHSFLKKEQIICR